MCACEYAFVNTRRQKQMCDIPGTSAAATGGEAVARRGGERRLAPSPARTCLQKMPMRWALRCELRLERTGNGGQESSWPAVVADSAAGQKIRLPALRVRVSAELVAMVRTSA